MSPQVWYPAYITDTVGVAVLMTGAADVLSLVVTTTSEDTDHVMTLTLSWRRLWRLIPLQIIEMLQTGDYRGSNDDLTMQELERAMRDLVLRVGLEIERASSSTRCRSS
jgi:hypothetical protein